jgi:outer membrane protein assembly factor BamB
VDLREAVGVTSGPFGLASSPLAVGELILVHPGSPTGPRLVAFRADTGKQEWSVGTAAVGYCTPHLAVIGGVPQVLVFNGDGLFAHDRVTGKELWAYEWKAETTAPVVVQPLVLSGDRIVLGSGRPGVRSRCIKVVRKDDTWRCENVWQAPFAPAFNDLVRFGDYLYALDGGRLVCVDVNTGKRLWKEGHYGSGQLLRAGNRLIVQDESGPLALINPSPETRQELGVVEALSKRTWNHPVIANGRLFVRNACEMVCYQVSP